MARRAMMILVATAVVMAYRSIPATAQTGCTAEIISLAPCLSYISGNSTAPPSSCCSQLSNVVRSQPLCLCTVLNGGFSIGISLNKTRALALPGACKVQTPPVSKCNATSSGGPTTSPAKSPAATPSSPVSPSSNPAPSTSPTGTGPSANGSKSRNGSSNKSVVLFMLSAVFFASCF
ncbi:hypothetical protein KFK09_019395 [Dendrobium nobile]|uniref:Bifunctional inhibitor/plant lipid transfer protein/seed storage helical domain-containing protein n=1 Tax=Dendrobium nobile TaxID=94219 RepID=A0A8T3AQU0_DENNO|nr:hypothetical protein KFK09_019395 [Dendrobium nobile]